MKGIKLWLLIAGVLMGTGLALGAIGTARGGTWKFRLNAKNMSISTSEDYITDTVKTDPFTDLKILSHVTDINISTGDSYSITYHVPEDRIPKIGSNGKTLTIDADEEDGFFIFDFTFASNENPYINITIPKEDKDLLDSLYFEGSTSDITINSINFKDVELISSTGDIRVSDSENAKLSIQTSTGDIHLDNLSLKSLKTECSTGDVYIKNVVCEGEYISDTSTGDVTINSSVIDSFGLNGSTSDVKVTSSEINRINIETSTGEVELSLKGTESDYNIECNSNTGDITINGKEYEDNYTRINDGKHSAKIHTSTGDIDIDFVK